MDNASVFVVGEVLYISNAGYFQVVSLTTNSITVCFLYKDVTDNGRIFSGAQIVSAGVQGEKGSKGRVASTILTCTPGTSQNTFTITVDDSRFVVSGSVVYLQGSGYFRTQKTVQSNTFTLTLVSQASGDSGIPAVGSFLIAAGPRGRRGNNNGGNYSRNKREKKERKQVRVEETFFLFSSSLEKHAGEAKKETVLNLSEKISVSFQGKGIFSPRNNREVSDSVESITVSKKCPEGKKLVSGKCRWNLVSTVNKKKVWCKAEDISQGEEGCSNCISSFKTMERKVEGKKEQVVTSIVFTKADGNKEKVEMNGESCFIIETRDADIKELGECGYFCMFHTVYPSTVSKEEFGCIYTPASTYGADELLNILSSKQEKEKQVERVEMITVDLICANL